MGRRPVETRNDRRTSDECPEEDIAAAEFRGSNLHLPWLLDDLKDRVRTCWESLDQQIINKSIDHWRDRLKAVVRVNGGHIEQLFLIRYLLNLLSCSVVYRKFMHSKTCVHFAIVYRALP